MEQVSFFGVDAGSNLYPYVDRIKVWIPWAGGDFPWDRLEISKKIANCCFGCHDSCSSFSVSKCGYAGSVSVDFWSW